MTMKTTPESCKTELCQYDSATRTRFYNGMLLTEEHLRREQEYHRNALKRVVRNLFGSGIVCGLGVHIDENGFCVTIDPGVAIDCCGNVIEVCKCIRVDLSKECKDRFGDCNSQTQTPQPFKKYLVLRYKEIAADPEPVLTPSSECKPAGEETKCEPSSAREGYCIELSDKCPCAVAEPQPGKDLITELKEGDQRYRPAASIQTPAGQTANVPTEPVDCLNLPLPCSPCDCCEAAVGLATLQFNCRDQKFDKTDQCDCRRHVMSPGLLQWILSRIKRNLPTETEALLRGVGDPRTKNLIGTVIELNRRGDEFKRLDNEMKKGDADVVSSQDVTFKRFDDEMKQTVDAAVKNLRDVEMKQMIDAESNKRENEIKKRDAAIKKREDDIKKLRDEVKKLTEDLSKQREKYPI